MRWRVQLGINSTSDVWKFCQNWTSRRGEFNLANFQTSRVQLIPIVRATSHDYLFIISMTKLDTYFSMSTSYSLAKAKSCQIFNQNLVLLFVFSFSSFVHWQNFVLLFVFSSSFSRAISFHICV